MKTKSMFAGLGMVGLALALTALPAPALAQVGGVSGKVVDEAGNPVPDAEIVLSNPTGEGTTTLKTNAKGEYQALGIRPIDFQIKATKGNMVGVIPRIKIGIGGATAIPTIVMKSTGPSALGGAAAGVEAKKLAEVEATAKAAQAAVEAGNLDEALSLYNKVAAEVPKCDVCYLQIGDLSLKKKDEAGAEAAYKKAIEADPTKPQPYSALAALYNGQRKFNEANEMSARATDLMSASGSTDPIAVLNQGIILWNQSKIPEAKAQFQKVIELDPKNADAHYWVGMALVNEGKMPEAGKEFQEYLNLAPTGQHADTAKAILATIK